MIPYFMINKQLLGHLHVHLILYDLEEFSRLRYSASLNLGPHLTMELWSICECNVNEALLLYRHVVQRNLKGSSADKLSLNS